MTKETLLIICVIFSTGFAKSQSPFFIESQQIPNFLNPALTGIHGSHNVRLVYQENYWEEFFDFSTIGASFEYSNLFCNGIFNSRFDGGISIIRDQEGNGNFSTTLLNLNLVYTIPFKTWGLLHNVRVGLGMGNFEYHSIDWTKLTFSDQIDPEYGPIGGTDFVAPEYNSTISYSPSIGIVYKTQLKDRFSLKIGLSSRYLFANDRLGLLKTGQLEKDITWTLFIYPEFALVNTRFYLGLEPTFLVQKEEELYNFQVGSKIHYNAAHGFGIFLSTGRPSNFSQNIKSLTWNVFFGFPVNNDQIIMSTSFIQNIGLSKEFGDTFQVGFHYYFRRNGCGRLNSSRTDCFNFEVDNIYYDHIWVNPGTGKMNTPKYKRQIRKYRKSQE